MRYSVTAPGIPGPLQQQTAMMQCASTHPDGLAVGVVPRLSANIVLCSVKTTALKPYTKREQEEADAYNDERWRATCGAGDAVDDNKIGQM